MGTVIELIINFRKQQNFVKIELKDDNCNFK